MVIRRANLDEAARYIVDNLAPDGRRPESRKGALAGGTANRDDASNRDGDAQGVFGATDLFDAPRRRETVAADLSGGQNRSTVGPTRSKGSAGATEALSDLSGGQNRSTVGRTRSRSSPGPSEARTPTDFAPAEVGYRRIEITADRLAGIPLRLAGFFASYWPSSLLVRRIMFSQLGIARFRALDLSRFPPSAAPKWAVPPAMRLAPAVDLETFARAPATRSAIAPLHDAYARGDASPIETAEAFIRARDADASSATPLNAFTASDDRSIRAQARASAERYRNGEARGPLDGILVAVKDQIDVAGYPTGVGLRLGRSVPASSDAELIARLRDAGAIIVGKTNMHEIGLGVTGVNPTSGIARNARDRSRVAGGSSGGSAAAVAAGMVLIAVASDAGGSTRIPAALNGVVGLKPTHGRMSQEGVYPLAPSLQQPGPIARNVHDAAILYAAMATPSAAPVRLDGITNLDLRGKKIGVFRAWNEDADPDVVRRTDEAIARLARRGAEIVPISLSGLDDIGMAQMILYAKELLAAQTKSARAQRPKYSAEAKLTLALARGLRAGDYLHAQRVRSRAMRMMAEVLSGVDAVLTPSTSRTAPPIARDAASAGESDLKTVEALSRFTALANVTGLPAITVPAGEDESGLPIGVQLIGRPWEEHVLLRMANAHEAEFVAEEDYSGLTCSKQRN